MEYVIEEKLRPAILSNLDSKFQTEGVLQACNHCVDDLIANRITVNCESVNDVTKKVTELVESMVGVVDELP